jgi:hypothetical protein
MQALARLTAVVVFLIPPLEVAIEMIRGLVRIGGFAFGMTLSLNTLLEKEDNLIGKRFWSSAIKQSSLCVVVRHTSRNLFPVIIVVHFAVLSSKIPGRKGKQFWMWRHSVPLQHWADRLLSTLQEKPDG